MMPYSGHGDRRHRMIADIAVVGNPALRFTDLHQNQSVSDAAYTRVLARLGEHGPIGLIGVSGYYTFLVMVLNAARTALPKGIAAPLVSFPR